MARIMIIDDDVEFAGNVKMMLEGDGHQVRFRDNLDGALEDLQAEKPDLLILDVMFPENAAGGFDLARAIRGTEELGRLPVILLTSINQEFPMGFSAGDIDPEWMPVQDFVEKPASVKEILGKVKTLLDKAGGKP